MNPFTTIVPYLWPLNLPMVSEINVGECLCDKDGHVLLDVRSPAEYHQGHIPGAVSFPLFSDEERAQVGTLYKHASPDAAMQRGLEIVGPRMPEMIDRARAISAGRQITVHCWRGGKRSASVAWLLDFGGLEATVLSGGYKAYRSFVHRWFESIPLHFITVGGKTGSNKTGILRALREMGEQVLDLEYIASHKGSAFGAIGEKPQPSTEQYENQLFEELRKMDFTRRIWTEDESRTIGRVYIPEALWTRIKSAPMIQLDVPMKLRVANLVHQYADKTDPDLLISSFERIRKRLGGQHADAAIKALQEGDFHTAAAIALTYYDKTYHYGLRHSKSQMIETVAVTESNVEDLCGVLIHHAEQMLSSVAVE